MSSLAAPKMTGLASTEQILIDLRRVGSVADVAVATTLLLADRLQKPILVEGPAGVGKT